MRLSGDTEIHGTATHLGCQVRRLQLRRGECRGFRNMRLWADSSQSVNLVLAHPTGLPVGEPWFLISTWHPISIGSGAKRSGSAVSSCSAIRKPVCSTWQTAVCENRSGSIGCCS